MTKSPRSSQKNSDLWFYINEISVSHWVIRCGDVMSCVITCWNRGMPQDIFSHSAFMVRLCFPPRSLILSLSSPSSGCVCDLSGCSVFWRSTFSPFPCLLSLSCAPMFAYSRPSVTVRVRVTSCFILLSLSHVHCVQFCFPCYVMPDLSLSWSHVSPLSTRVSSCVYIVSVPLCPSLDLLFVSMLRALSVLVWVLPRLVSYKWTSSLLLLLFYISMQPQ